MTHENNRKAGWYWPWAIGGLLGMWVLGDITVVWIAANHPSFAVEGDYYQKALAWDEIKARREASDQLQWRANVSYLAPVAGVGSGPELVVALEDSAGTPVGGAAVTVRTFHSAYPKRVLQAELEEHPVGVYRAPLLMQRLGLWELEITARRGDDTFTRASLESYRGAP